LVLRNVCVLRKHQAKVTRNQRFCRFFFFRLQGSMVWSRWYCKRLGNAWSNTSSRNKTKSCWAVFEFFRALILSARSDAREFLKVFNGNHTLKSRLNKGLLIKQLKMNLLSYFTILNSLHNKKTNIVNLVSILVIAKHWVPTWIPLLKNSFEHWKRQFIELSPFGSLFNSMFWHHHGSYFVCFYINYLKFLGLNSIKNSFNLPNMPL
jgi:hypothetical protein